MNTAIHFIVASLLMIPVAGIAGLPDATIEVRLQKLGDILREFNSSGPNSSMMAERLVAGGNAYTFYWNQPAGAFDPVSEEQSTAKIVEIAIAFLKDKLPKELRPEASNLLVAAKYQISTAAKIPKWVWIAEFRVADQSSLAAFASTGYPPTLFVPLSMKGTVLLDVQKVSLVD